MRLYEHPDFAEAITRAAEYFRSQGLRESLIEKDYFVTAALRSIALVGGDRVIFKGGTSLSKGWNLIQRFSEDVDIFLDPAAFVPPLGKGAVNRELKKLKEAVEKHPGLTFLPEESQTIGGFGRNDRFEYRQQFRIGGDIRNRLLIEAGTASGRQPTQRVRLRSYLGEFLSATGVSLEAEDEGDFEILLLHFRRTFVEKMFAIHGKVEAYRQEGRDIGAYARHYYDLYCLAARPEVREMLQSDEYAEIKTDYDRISRQHFDRGYVPPPGMSFAQSVALFPTGELKEAIAKRFETQCRLLCFGTPPAWEDVEQRLAALRPWL